MKAKKLIARTSTSSRRCLGSELRGFGELSRTTGKAFVHYADEDGLSQLALRTTRNYNENRTAGPFLKARPLSIVSVYALESLL